jgi:hypothetical protein
VRRRLTPHPLGTFETPLRLRQSPGNGLPCTYVACSDPPYPPAEHARREMRDVPAGPGRRSPLAMTPWYGARDTRGDARRHCFDVGHRNAAAQDVEDRIDA